MNHPLQAQLWTLLDRVQVRKAWAIDLEVAESEVSRWATGKLPMSLDDLVACVRICRRVGQELIGLRVATMLISAVDPRRSDPDDAPVDAHELTVRLAGLVGEAAAVLFTRTNDPKRLDDLAERLEGIALTFRRLASNARR